MSVKHTNGGQAVCTYAYIFLKGLCAYSGMCGRTNAEGKGKYQLVQFILHLLYYIARYLTLNYLILMHSM